MHKGLKVIISEEEKCNLVWKFIAFAHWFYCEYYDICCQPLCYHTKSTSNKANQDNLGPEHGKSTIMGKI